MNGVFAITGLDLTMSELGWDFARDKRAEIERHWARVTADRPSLWNGAVLLCREAEVSDGVFSARFVATDYASFVAWRDWGRPDADVWSCFGVPVVFSADGGLLIGIMGQWTLNAGKAYPPSGSLEPRDVRPGGVVDLVGSMVTELREETGLELSQSEAGEMVAVFDGPRIAVARRHTFPLPFAALEQHFARHTASDPKPELEGVEAIWKSSQIDSRMPPYAAEIVKYFLG